MRCALCHHPYIPDVRGFEPAVLCIAGDEQFIVHSHCADEVTTSYDKFQGTKRDFYITTVLRKLSQ